SPSIPSGTPGGRARPIARSTLLVTSAALLAVAACSADRDRSIGQTRFESAPPNSVGGGGPVNTDDTGGSKPGAGTAGFGVPAARTVEETDLYRLDGNRLYYLNSYRGLM